MTPQSQILALAQWSGINPEKVSRLSDELKFPTLDDVHEFRKRLNQQQIVDYLNHLRSVLVKDDPDYKVSDFDLVDAELEEHYEALLRTLNLWKE